MSQTNNLKDQFFDNGVKIVFDKSKVEIKRKDFIDAIKGMVDVQYIEVVNQYKYNNSWYCFFKTNFDSSKIVGKTILIKTMHFELEPAIAKTMIKCFKISWLPGHFNKIEAK